MVHFLRSPAFRSQIPLLAGIAAYALAGTLSVSTAFAQMSTIEKMKSGAEHLVAPFGGKTDDKLTEIMPFSHQVTGVTVTETGRIFVSFPRWTEDAPISVAEVLKDGLIKAYPDDEWNSWRNARMGEVSPGDHFVCVQSVVADGQGSLWVVDPAAPNLDKTVKDGPKLVRIDLKSDKVTKTFAIGPDVAGPASYLNDVRIAPDGRFAYLTDSGSPGGLVIVDLSSGKAWRALSGDASTQAEKDVVVITDGQPLKRPDGRPLQVNADSLALSADGHFLYWKPLTGKTLYRIATDVLQQAGTNPDAVKGKIEKVAEVEPTDGLWVDKSNRIYLSAIDENAVKVLEPGGEIKTLIKDSRLRWPDTFSQGPDGAIYVTASHIQDSPWFHPSGWSDSNFTLFKFMPEPAQEQGRSSSTDK